MLGLHMSGGRRFNRKSRYFVWVVALTVLVVCVRYHVSVNYKFVTNVNDYDETQVIVDVQLLRCSDWLGCVEETSLFSTVSPEQRSLHLLPKPLNLYGSKFSIFPTTWFMDHYLAVEKQDIEVATRAISRVIVAPYGDIPQEVLDDSDVVATDADLVGVISARGWVKRDLPLNSQFWVKYDDVVDTGADKFIRNIDILFGYGDLVDSRPGWDFIKHSIGFSNSKIPVHLSLNRKKYVSSQEDRITTKKNRFKILQLSDLHITTEIPSECVYSKDKRCQRDALTLKFVTQVLEREDIDLVVISGDLIDASKTRDFKSTIIKALQPILAKKIPFSFTFGESDERLNNVYGSKDDIVSFINRLPHSHTFPFPNADVHGLTNYYIRIYREKRPTEGDINISQPDALVYLFDSTGNTIDSSQVRLVNTSLQKVDKNHFPFMLSFFHYPLPNYRPSGPFKMIGSYNEKHRLNTHTSASIRDDLAELGMNVVSVGKEQQNDACLLSERKDSKGEIVDDIWLCYSGMGDKYEANRRARIFEIDFEKMRLISWKIDDKTGKSFDHQNIYRAP